MHSRTKPWILGNHEWYQVKGPFWVTLVAHCLQNYVPAGWSHHSQPRLPPQDVRAMLLTASISLCTIMELRMSNRVESSRFSRSFILLENSSQPDSDGPECSELVVHCTVEDIFDSIRTDESTEDPNGPVECANVLAQPVRWSPSGCKTWLNLQLPQQHTDHSCCGAGAVFIWRHSWYEINNNCVVRLSSGEMDKLTHTELDAVIGNHFDPKKCSVGQFFWTLGDPVFGRR